MQPFSMTLKDNKNKHNKLIAQFVPLCILDDCV